MLDALKSNADYKYDLHREHMPRLSMHLSCNLDYESKLRHQEHIQGTGHSYHTLAGSSRRLRHHKCQYRRTGYCSSFSILYALINGITVAVAIKYSFLVARFNGEIVQFGFTRPLFLGIDLSEAD